MRPSRRTQTTATYAGNLKATFCDDTRLLDIAWFCGNAENRTQPVGSRTPNAWGLYDMPGNVPESTHDWYGRHTGDAADPAGSATGTGRVSRGGSWDGGAPEARAASRLGSMPDTRSISRGFRLARTTVSSEYAELGQLDSPRCWCWPVVLPHGFRSHEDSIVLG
jgi:formylglycine-generating enzyme required for sulfatase activity